MLVQLNSGTYKALGLDRGFRRISNFDQCFETCLELQNIVVERDWLVGGDFRKSFSRI
jgi:hypothetical protein